MIQLSPGVAMAMLALVAVSGGWMLLANAVAFWHTRRLFYALIAALWLAVLVFDSALLISRPALVVPPVVTAAEMLFRRRYVARLREYPNSRAIMLLQRPGGLSQPPANSGGGLFVPHGGELPVRERRIIIIIAGGLVLILAWMLVAYFWLPVPVP